MPALTFVTFAEGEADVAAARLLIDSLREFGGDLGRGSMLVFVPGAMRERAQSLVAPPVEVVPLHVPAGLDGVPFAGMTAACALAEERAPSGSLVWVDPRVLFCRPPVLLDLAGESGVAVRPVHIANVGSRWGDPPDAYWRRIFEAAGVSDAPFPVESFVDGLRLRAYFNSHVVAVDPRLGLWRRRSELVALLAADVGFLAGPCADGPHRLFLFQAAFAATVAASVSPDRVRLLPPGYGYPYNLQDQVPEGRRCARLDELVCFAWEGRDLRPGSNTDVEVREPLRSWLSARAGVVAVAS